MRIGLVAVQGCFTSGVSSLLDILGTAEALRSTVDPTIPPIEVTVAGFRRHVVTSAGLTVPTSRRPEDIDDVDTLVIPALGPKQEHEIPELMNAPDVRRLVALLPTVVERGTAIAAACTAVFPFAESGVLDGRRATTTWWLAGAFRRRYPAVELDLDAMIITDGNLVTAGAAFAHIDLALSLVRRASAALAEYVARYLVIDERAAQSIYVAVDHLSHRDPTVLAFERHVRAHLAAPVDLAEVASRIGASRRTLERRVSETLGMSPLNLVQRMRAQRATHLLRTTDQTMDQVAPKVGYANASTLRALLRRYR